MNRQFIFTKCFHVPPHGVQEFLNSSRSQVQVCTFKEGKKHGEERHFWRGFDPLNIQRKLDSQGYDLGVLTYPDPILRNLYPIL
jgi:hypothetical protein